MSIIERSHFDVREFKREFLDRQPVVYRNVIGAWPATRRWTFDYFERVCPDIPVVSKVFKPGETVFENCSMQAYLDAIRAFKREHGDDPTKVGPYCHDIPVFLLAPQLLDDVRDFPAALLPPHYRQHWWKYVQFFMSARGGVTPLHFDTLMSHNIFFQIAGRKRFTLIDPADKVHCYRRGWRWFDVNPENPDYERHPAFRKVAPRTVEVRGGDMFYMPPETMHHVRSLDDCVSFNIDFHTVPSVLRSFLAIRDGIPRENLYYNYLCLRGLIRRRHDERRFERYRPYLNYVS